MRTRRFVGRLDVNAIMLIEMPGKVTVPELVEDLIKQSQKAETLVGPRGGRYVVAGPIEIVGTQQTITGMSIAWRTEGRYVRPGRE